MYQVKLSDLDVDEFVSDGVTWRLGTAADVPRLTKESHNYDESRREEALRALQAGDRFLIAEIDGDIAHIVWWTRGEVYFPGQALPLGPGSAYVFNGRTAPKYLGRRLQRAGLREVTRILRKEGNVFRILALVDEAVKPAVANFEKEPSTIVGRATVYRLLRSWHYVRMSDGLASDVASRVSG